MSFAKEVIAYQNRYRSQRLHSCGPELDWEEFDALAKSHDDLERALKTLLGIAIHEDNVPKIFINRAKDAIARANGEQA